MRNRHFSTLVCTAAAVAASLCATAQAPANGADPDAPTAATMTPERIDAQWIAANRKYDGERRRILANVDMHTRIASPGVRERQA